MTDRMSWNRNLLGPATLLTLILLLGFALRLSWPFAYIAPSGEGRPNYGTLPGDIPFGFHPDEGHNALDAWRIASDGWRPIFLERNNGREPLFMYLMAACMAVLGPTIQAVRTAGALAGLAAIAAQFLLIRALPLRRPIRVALLSAAGLAFTFWPMSQARYALRAGLLPVWVALMLWAWWHAIRDCHGEGTEVGVRGDREILGGETSVTGVTGGSDASTGISAIGATREIGAFGPTRGTGAIGATRGIGAFGPTREIGATGRTGAAFALLRGSGLVWAALAGLFVGLAVHTHLSGRVLPAVLVASALWVLIRERRPSVLIRLSAALLVAFLVAWPQIDYFRERPEMLGYRADQVSVLNPEVNEGDLFGTLLTSGWNLAKMPLFEGDRSWHHNIRRRPVFDDIGSKLTFVLGLAVFAGWLLGRAGRAAQSAAFLLAITLGVMLMPSWLSIGAPNYVRLTGIWPALFLLPALGLDRAAAWTEEWGPSRRASRPRTSAGRSGLTPIATDERYRAAALALLVIAPTWLLITSARDYFGEYAGRREVYDAFNGAAVERGQALAGLPPGPTYVTPALWNQAVIRFLNIERPPRGTFDPSQGIVFPHADPVSDPERELDEAEPLVSARYAFDPADFEAADAFAGSWPSAEREDITGRADGPLAESVNMVTFALTDDRMEAILNEISELEAPMTFGAHLRLERLSVEPALLRAGQPMVLEMVWTALAPTEFDHNFFLRLVSDADGSAIAEFDGPPLGGSYPTDLWNPGERVLMPLRLELTDDAPAGPATLVHGWYDWRDGRRLPIDGDGDGDGAAEIATLEVATLGVAVP